MVDQLKANRVTSSTEVGTVPSHWSDLEEALAYILAIVLDTNVTVPLLGVDPATSDANAGIIEKDVLRQKAASPVGIRIRNSTNDKEFRIVLSGTDILIDENTGTEGTPIWTNRLTMAVGTGNMAIPGTATFAAAVVMATTLGVTGAVTLGSTLGVTGAVTLGSTLGVTGAATLASAAVTGALTKGGNAVVSTGDTGSVSATMLATASVETAKIKDENVTPAKLSFNPVPAQVAGGITVHENDDAVSTSNGYYTKLKESLLGAAASGTLTISFTLAATTSNLKCRIYKNGVAVGTERTLDHHDYAATYSESIADWEGGDYLQVYAYVESTGAGRTATVSNLKIKTSNPLWATVVT